MNILVCAHVRNEAALMPFFLRHYATFASCIIIFDDGSTDGTREIVAAHPIAELRDLPFTGLDEGKLLALAHEEVRKARDKCGIVMWPDVDEFITHSDVPAALKRYMQAGYDVVRPLGFNAVGEGLPEDDGKSQLLDLMTIGVPAPVYSKPIIVNPAATIEWGLGKHVIARPGTRINPWGDVYAPDPWRLRLHHFRFLGFKYCSERNARQYARSTDKGAAWTCDPAYRGEHSAQWAQDMIKYGKNVAHDAAHYWSVPGIWPRLPKDA